MRNFSSIQVKMTAKDTNDSIGLRRMMVYNWSGEELVKKAIISSSSTHRCYEKYGVENLCQYDGEWTSAMGKKKAWVEASFDTEEHIEWIILDFRLNDYNMPKTLKIVGKYGDKSMTIYKTDHIGRAKMRIKLVGNEAIMWEG